MHQEEITIQSLSVNDCIKVSYCDNNVMIVDDVQEFAAIGAARLSLNGIAICTNGKITGSMNGRKIEISKNEVAIIPKNALVTDLMISPDFKLKALFFSENVLQSFLHEKISIWNEMMYIHCNNVFTLGGDDVKFYEHFYSLLKFVVERGKNRPYYNEVVQSLLKSALLGVCSEFKYRQIAAETPPNATDDNLRSSPAVYFQRFLDIIHTVEIKHRTVEWYARQLCITPKYLSAVCKSCSGKTALEWITESLMEKIRFYLCDTDLSIKQICDILGFANTSFFGRYVKEHFGMPPAQMRKSGAEGRS
ncbi:MAG: AraC family transcriptional regulator [Bacteroidales bacterium]|nr:AraC family transcriptional regulator [Bacteroidales bacterium]